MMIRKYSTLALLIVVATAITLPSFVPTRRARPIDPLKMTIVNELSEPDRLKTEARLDHLASIGFKRGASRIMKFDRQREMQSVWRRFGAVSAEDVSTASAYIDITLLDDGDPNTYEFYTYVHEYTGGGEAWGVVQGPISDPGGAWVFDDGTTGQMSQQRDSGFQGLLNTICPRVEARRDGCDGGFEWKNSLVNATIAGVAVAGGSLYNPVCWAGGWGSVGSCLGWGFVDGFAWNLGSSAVGYYWRCWA
jgi:hypothetical protein